MLPGQVSLVGGKGDIQIHSFHTPYHTSLDLQLLDLKLNPSFFPILLPLSGLHGRALSTPSMMQWSWAAVAGTGAWGL
jgi:hypothetical protein